MTPILPLGFEKLSVILPCYRLGKSIRGNIAAVAERFAPIAFEIVPVDDGSDDGTADGIRAAVAEVGAELVRPVFLPENRGKGAALQAGFAHCTGSHVLLLDGDLDLDPSLTWRFLEMMADTGADIVIGSKMHRESQIDYPWRRRLASVVYYSIVKLLIGLPVHDTQTGMKLFTRAALGDAFSRMLSKRFAFDLEVLAIAHGRGCKIVEAPIRLDFGGKAGCLTAKNVREVMTDTLGIFYRLRLLRYYATLEPRAMPSPPPSVSVVIACPGASRMLDECVAALAEQEYPSLEAIVLPDAPTGRVWPPFVREIPTGRVRPSDKRNAGIREARGEIVAFLDDDARPLDGWLAAAVPYFSDPAIAAVGGPAVTPPDDSTAAKLSGRVYANRLVSGAYRRRYVPVRVCDEDDLPSCNLLVRTSVLRELGGFDTRHWPGEDTILCKDIVHRLGGRMVYDPRAVVAHHRRPLFGPHLRQVARYASHRGFFCKRFPETSRRLSYMIPSAFLLGTVATIVLAPWRVTRPLACVGGWTLAFYAALVLLFSFPFPSPLHPLRWLHTWVWTAAGIVATHFVYGWNFLRGLFATSMPGGVKDFDHQGGKGA